MRPFILIAAPALGAFLIASPTTAAQPAASAGAAPRNAPRIWSTPTSAKPAAKPAPVKATAQERTEAERLDPLAQAAFWARQVDIDPKDAQAELGLSRALRALGRYDEAAAAADQLLVFEPGNYDALLESARARIGADKGFYAIDAAQRAEAAQPRDWRPVSLLAIALGQAHRDDEALAAHQKALALAPDNPATLTNLGMFYATHGDAAKAEPLLLKAAAAPGATSQERQNLALVLGLEGRFDEAERIERQDLPPDEVDNNLAYLRADDAALPARSWDSLKAVQ
jgi:Flp pilus assembly protein TadD